MNEQKVRDAFSRIELCKCSNDELIKMYWIFTSLNIKDLAEKVADYFYIRSNPPSVKLSERNLENPPTPLHNVPVWLTKWPWRSLWHQRP